MNNWSNFNPSVPFFGRQKSVDLLPPVAGLSCTLAVRDSHRHVFPNPGVRKLMIESTRGKRNRRRRKRDASNTAVTADITHVPYIQRNIGVFDGDCVFPAGLSPPLVRYLNSGASSRLVFIHKRRYFNAKTQWREDPKDKEEVSL